MSSFQYHEDVLEKFPKTVGGVILAHGLQNGPSPGPLAQAFANEQRNTLERIGEMPLSEIASLAAWRSVFRAFGVNPTKYRSAAEALLRRLTKKGDIPSINKLVDIANLVSIRYAIPVACFDTRALQGAVGVHFAGGTERFTPLFETRVEHPEPGEVVFSDETDLVIARRWCWRQSDESATREQTSEVIITVEAQHDGGGEDIGRALDDLLGLLGEFVGGETKSAVLGVDRPARL